MKTEMWIQLEPEFPPSFAFNSDKPIRVHVVNTTKNRPRQVKPGCVPVKIVIDVPPELFIPQTVEVEVEEPSNIRAVS